MNRLLKISPCLLVVVALTAFVAQTPSAQGQETIDILVSVNGTKLAQQVADGSIKPGTQAAPTSLGAWQQSDVYISMTCQNSHVANDGGKSELTVKAVANQPVRWTMQTFDGNSTHTAYIYGGAFNPADAITNLSYSNNQTSTYFPPEQDPLANPVEQNNTEWITSATIRKKGVTIQYTMNFALVDGETGKTIGYFMWDPFIQVAK